MKMSKPLYNRLKSDCMAVIAHHSLPLNAIDTGAKAWQVFHAVSFDRSYNDEHPAFAKRVKTRILPCTLDAGSDRRFIDLFYRDEGLHDTHIKTALKRIFPHAVFKN